MNKLEKARASRMIAGFLSENSQHIIDHATEFCITFYTAKIKPTKTDLDQFFSKLGLPWRMKTEKRN